MKSCGFDPEGISVEEHIQMTYDEDPKKRKMALKQLCPCNVKEDFDRIWIRIIELTHDESGMVRDQALHNLGDGSPRHLEHAVMEAAERLYNDPDPNVKKKARRMCISYRTNGKWNIL